MQLNVVVSIQQNYQSNEQATISLIRLQYVSLEGGQRHMDSDCDCTTQDYIDNLGPITNELNSHGIDSVAQLPWGNGC